MARKHHKRRKICVGKPAYSTQVAVIIAARDKRSTTGDSTWGWTRCKFGKHYHVVRRSRSEIKSAKAKARNRNKARKSLAPPEKWQ